MPLAAACSASSDGSPATADGGDDTAEAAGDGGAADAKGGSSDAHDAATKCPPTRPQAGMACDVVETLTCYDDCRGCTCDHGSWICPSLACPDEIPDAHAD